MVLGRCRYNVHKRVLQENRDAMYSADLQDLAWACRDCDRSAGLRGSANVRKKIVAVVVGQGTRGRKRELDSKVLIGRGARGGVGDVC